MIRLRDVSPEDKEMIREWRNRPEVAQHMYSDHHISVGEHDKWFDQAMRDPSRRYWIIMYDNKAVGLANIYDLDERNKRCLWAFYIADASVRGKGVGSIVEYSILHYVFDQLRLNKLCGEVLSSNQAVINMHEKFGFTQEGLFREHIVKGEAFVDIVCIAILRREWNEIKPSIEHRLQNKGLLHTKDGS